MLLFAAETQRREKVKLISFGQTSNLVLIALRWVSRVLYVELCGPQSLLEPPRQRFQTCSAMQDCWHQVTKKRSLKKTNKTPAGYNRQYRRDAASNHRERNNTHSRPEVESALIVLLNATLTSTHTPLQRRRQQGESGGMKKNTSSCPKSTLPPSHHLHD